MVQVVECLLSKHKALSSNLVLLKGKKREFSGSTEHCYLPKEYATVPYPGSWVLGVWEKQRTLSEKETTSVSHAFVSVEIVGVSSPRESVRPFLNHTK
jgi:hypothetical protein